MKEKNNFIRLNLLALSLTAGLCFTFASSEKALAQDIFAKNPFSKAETSQDFMREENFQANIADSAREEISLPDLASLKTSQEQSTIEMKVMMENIVSDLEGTEDITYKKPVMKSLFFNLTEYALIQEARRGFEARLPGTSNAPVSTSREIRARRNLDLSGIIYKDKREWSIYLNETRVTPNNLPDEIIDIEVHSDFVRLKWFDKGTNTIFPVKLRPNEVFNLDARLFFPG